MSMTFYGFISTSHKSVDISLESVLFSYTHMRCVFAFGPLILSLDGHLVSTLSFCWMIGEGKITLMEILCFKAVL